MTGFLDRNLADTAVAAVLFGVLPLLAVLQARALTPALLERIQRVPAYVSSMIALVAIGVLSVGAGTRGPRTLASMGVTFPFSFGGWNGLLIGAWTVALVAGVIAIVLTFRWMGVRSGVHEHPMVLWLLPESRTERAVFAVLSVVAGVCEEVAYRGYAIALLLPIFGAGSTVALTSVVFGLLHAYQGPLGMGRTAAVGTVFAVGFLGAGTLWPCIIAHVVYDLVAGLWLGPRLMVPGGASRV